MTDELRKLSDVESQEELAPEGPKVERLGESSLIAEELERLRFDETYQLPEIVVDLQKVLATMSEHSLRHLIVGASVQLAARTPTTTPVEILRVAVEAASFKDWEATKAKVRRIAADSGAPSVSGGTATPSSPSESGAAAPDA